MNSLEIRRAGRDDLGEILAIERSSAGAPQWSEAVWAGLLATGADLRAVFVAEQTEKLAGFIVVVCAAGVAEVESLAVADRMRRQGIGGILSAEWIAWARRAGAMQVELEVRASNESARRLYRSLGFLEQGVRRNYYNGPTEDAVLMGLPFSG